MIGAVVLAALTMIHPSNVPRANALLVCAHITEVGKVDQFFFLQGSGDVESDTRLMNIIRKRLIPERDRASRTGWIPIDVTDSGARPRTDSACAPEPMP
jgi:hypothetical protein